MHETNASMTAIEARMTGGVSLAATAAGSSDVARQSVPTMRAVRMDASLKTQVVNRRRVLHALTRVRCQPRVTAVACSDAAGQLSTLF